MNTILKGQVLDSAGNALSNVQIQINNDNIVPTDIEGNWSKTYSTTDIDIKDLTLIYTKENFEIKTVKNLQINNNIDGNDIIEIPRIVLQSISDIVPSITQKIISQLNIEETDILEKYSSSDLSFQIKLANNINLRKEDLKRTIIPYVLKLFIPFGTLALQATLNKLSINQIKDLSTCPSKKNLLEIINKRNKLANQINNIYSTVKLLNGAIIGLNITVSTIQAGISLIQTIPYPATGIPVLGLPPLTTGIIETTGLSVDKLNEQLKKSQISISILTITLASFGVLLGTILNLLSTLDQLIQKCSQDENIPFEEINNELNLLNNQSQNIEQTQQNLIYKEFKIELCLDETNQTQYPRRYAQALNKQGVPVLKTEMSFASNPQVLIDQIKFIIDSNPNLTAE